jgi:hypothetical protein
MAVPASMSCSAEELQWQDALGFLCDVERVCVTAGAFAEGMELARVCRHPDAQWLCALFPDPGERLTEGLIEGVMETQGEDRRALFIISCLLRPTDPRKNDLLRRSAGLGYAPAQAACFDDEDMLSKGVAHGNRHAMFSLGNLWLRRGDTDRAMSLWKLAAQLGHSEAQWTYAERLPRTDPARYLWLGRSAAKGHFFALMRLRGDAVALVETMGREYVPGVLVFALGRALLGQVKESVKSALRSHRENGGECSKNVLAWATALQCVECYEQCIVGARAAIEAWIAAGRRLAVARDLRCVIARTLWEQAAHWMIAFPLSVESANN